MARLPEYQAVLDQAEFKAVDGRPGYVRHISSGRVVHYRCVRIETTVRIVERKSPVPIRKHLQL